MHSRRTFLAQAAAGAAASPLLAQSTKLPKNVLVMIADDLGLHTGAYGDQTAAMPNLDRLASEGVRFTNAYCTTASCSASRSVILSGLHNHANGQYGHAHDFHHFAYLPKVKPLPSLLKDAGYQTGVIGKLHVNPVERFQWDLHSEGAARDVSDMASRARTFIQGSDGKPWYLHVGYADPHRAEKGFANRDYKGVTRKRFDPAKMAVPSFLPDNSEVRDELAEYYEAANRMDQGIGKILDVLRETGQMDNTLILFFSDNGMAFPNAKTNLYDAGSRLPLIVRSPSQTKRGLVTNAMVNWADITPTILEWTGAKAPTYPLHGKSFLPVLEQENPAGWDRVFYSHTFHEITMYYPVRGVRTKTHKYLLNLFPELSFPHASDLFESKTWQSVRAAGETGMLGQRKASKYLHRDAEELYELSSDPNEVKNLAIEPQHRAQLEALRREVQQFRVETKDPWLINDNYR
jgi:N-sulfoglucosamine sulfohydrolase